VILSFRVMLTAAALQRARRAGECWIKHSPSTSALWLCLQSHLHAIPH